MGYHLVSLNIPFILTNALPVSYSISIYLFPHLSVVRSETCQIYKIFCPRGDFCMSCQYTQLKDFTENIPASVKNLMIC